MTPLEVLIELVDRLGAGGEATVLISKAELCRWPDEAVRALKSQHIIAKAKAANSAVCPGCEEECVMPVHTLPTSGAERHFLLCEQRDDTNRVPVTADHLLQWRCSLELICGFAAASLGLHRGSLQRNQTGLLEIGIVAGKKQVQMICLEVANRLRVVVGQERVDLAALVAYDKEGYSLNQGMIQRLVDSSNTADERYTPSVVGRENRKLGTKKRYDSWKKQYKLLKKNQPDKSDSWIAGAIAKMPIGKNHSADTIRKNMK